MKAGNVEGWTLEQQGDGRDRPRMYLVNTGGLLESVAFISSGSKPIVHTQCPTEVSLTHLQREQEFQGSGQSHETVGSVSDCLGLF